MTRKPLTALASQMPRRASDRRDPRTRPGIIRMLANWPCKSTRQLAAVLELVPHTCPESDFGRVVSAYDH